MTPLNSQTGLRRVYFLLKGKSNKNISMANIPILYKYLKKKSWGLP
jgi:hypothetical protein